MAKIYSDWLKIDLHIHTSESNKTKQNDYQGSFSVSLLKEKLKENNVSIFSLTDHNIINVASYEEYFKAYDSSLDPLLLVGIELDIKVETKKYHSILVFNYSTIDKCRSVSQRLEEKYIEKGILEPTKRMLTLSEIGEIFKDDDFFFIPHAGNFRSIVEAYSNNIAYAQRMVLLMPSVAFEKVSEARQGIYTDGFNRQRNPNNQDDNDIAYIDFSDNHCSSNYPCVGKNGLKHVFNYIKGSKNFESIRLAFIDPESRIKTEPELRNIQTGNAYIQSLKLKDNSNITNCEIEFSPHLNVMIGGRSSGKSLFMYILGTKINRLIPNEISNKYRSRDIKSEIKLSTDSNYQENTSSINKDEVIYLNQGDIVGYFEENNLENLALETNKDDIYQEKKGKFIKHKDNLLSLVKQVIDAYRNVQSVTQTPIYKIPESIIHQQLSTKFVFKVNTSRDSQELLNEIDQAKILIDRIESLVVELKKNKIIDLSVSEHKIINDFEQLLLTKKSQLDTREKILGIKERFRALAQNIVDEKNSGLDQEARQKANADLFTKNMIQNINKRFKALGTLRTYTKSLQNFNYDLKETIEISNDVTLVLEVFRKKEEIIDLINDGLRFDNNTQPTTSLFLSLLQLLNQKISIKNYGEDRSPEVLNKKISVQLDELLKSINEPKDYLFYSSDGSNSINNSPGYNSEKYLDIIMRNDSIKYVFIDQPEDNLSNTFISDKLVRIIREEKFKKQLFLVTHNPSIVVYGDAENIIISENKSNTIKYRQVVLEDESSQKDICQFLDGGQYIFDMRAKKYNIQRLLRESQI